MIVALIDLAARVLAAIFRLGWTEEEEAAFWAERDDIYGVGE